MDFETIRDHFKNLMPANLCKTSVDFFNDVEQREALVAHLKAYHHWSIYKNLLTRQNLEILGVEFGNDRGIYIGKKPSAFDIPGQSTRAKDIKINGGGAFIFEEIANDVEVYDDNDFIYFRQTSASRVFIAGNVKHLSLLPDTRIEEIIVVGKIDNLRIYDSSIGKVSLEKEVPGAEVKRLIFGRGGRINNYDKNDFCRIVGD